MDSFIDNYWLKEWSNNFIVDMQEQEVVEEVPCFKVIKEATSIAVNISNIPDQSHHQN